MIGPDVFQYEVIYLSGGGKASSRGFALGPAIAALADVSLDDIKEHIERVVSLRLKDRDFESVETDLSHPLNGFSHLKDDKKESPEVVLEKGEFMFYRRRLFSIFATVILGIVASLSAGTLASAAAGTSSDENKKARVEAPLNIAILIQDDLIPSVGNEIRVTADFIRSLPEGSRVMVGYITAGTLQVRQPFTTDTDRAARSLRIPIGSASAAPFNPYVEVIEGLRHFDASWKGRNALLLISDGLDVSRGLDATAAGHTLDLERAIREANSRQVAVYSFYAPSVGLTSHSRLAASYGQSSLNRLSDDTGGRAFFQGTTGFVTFDSYFARLRAALNAQYARAY